LLIRKLISKKNITLNSCALLSEIKSMDFVKLAAEIEERYRRYLRTTFYLRDPELRGSFDRALQEGRLSKGPYIEVTPAYRRSGQPRTLFQDIIGTTIDPKLLGAIDGDRALYAHQEEAIRRVAAGRNIVVATGTGSGKTECFLYPILLHLYREHLQGTLTMRPGVRALVLYPMNALAYDQRDRLGRLHARLEESSVAFRFSFGQYTGATPDDKKDSYRHASDVIAHRFSGELVLRDEMRAMPPHILLTNFSMLEYQLLRPDDSPLFDDAHGRTWTFLVLDEAHQYRGTRGAEMSLLLRRLKQRLRKSGNDHSFRCIATSATLAGGDDDRAAVASFAKTLFDEPFEAEDVILAKTEDIPQVSIRRFPADAYGKLCEAIDKNDPTPLGAFEEITSNSAREPTSLSIAARVGKLLAQDSRTKTFRDYMGKGPREVPDVADEIFSEAAPGSRTGALTAFADILNRAEQPHSSGPFLSVRYHLFLRALEGAFIRYEPEKEITLAPQSNKEKGGLSFELALCRECGQHYLVGRQVNGFLAEAIRDPSRDDFGVSFFRPVSKDKDDADIDAQPQSVRSNLCVRCGILWPVGTPRRCDHATHILVEEQAPSDQHADQMQQCATCGYRGQDPVR
jgi:DEAD/DEAH box helicase